MDDPRRAILVAVVEGRLSPQEAAARLDDPPLAEPPPGSRAGHTDLQKTRSGVRRVRISGTYRNLRVLGDQSVTEAVAEGPHRARHEVDALVISATEDDGLDGFTFGGFGGWGGAGWSGLGGGRGRRQSSGPFGPFGPFGGIGSSTDPPWAPFVRGHASRHLIVRSNPDLPIEAELSAGSLSISGVHAALKVEVSAGSARLDGVRSTLDVAVHAGSVHVRGRLDRGSSHIRCEAGSVGVELERGSSVRIRTDGGPGWVRLPSDGDAPLEGLTLGGDREAQVGGGEGLLRISSTMGTVHVRTVT